MVAGSKGVPNLKDVQPETLWYVVFARLAIFLYVAFLQTSQRIGVLQPFKVLKMKPGDRSVTVYDAVRPSCPGSA